MSYDKDMFKELRAKTLLLFLFFLLLFFFHPSYVFASLKLSTPSTTVVNKSDIALTITGLNQCVNHNVGSLTLHLKYKKLGKTIDKNYDFGKKDTYELSTMLDIGSLNKDDVDIWISAGWCGDVYTDPNGIPISQDTFSNTITLAVLSQSEANSARPEISINPNPPYLNEKATFKSTKFNESGCPDGNLARLIWKNSYAAGAQEVQKDIKIENNSISFDVTFNSEDKKQALVQCIPNNETKYAVSIPIEFQPIVRKNVETPLAIETPVPPTLVPPSPPCANPAYGKGSYDPATGNCRVLKTAVGDISTDPKGFIKNLFQILLSVSGGIALLLIIRGGYKYMTSQGNPETTKAAQEEITSAIVGLLFLIFSMVILQIIGVDLLKIPGLGQ